VRPSAVTTFSVELERLHVLGCRSGVCFSDPVCCSLWWLLLCDRDILLQPQPLVSSLGTLLAAVGSMITDTATWWQYNIQVNSTLKSTTEAPHSIGILDIFGFEVFELNSANEKLQVRRLWCLLRGVYMLCAAELVL
jgi:hypothetical protein